MTRRIVTNITLAALLAAAPASAFAQSPTQQDDAAPAQESALAADTLSRGETDAAIAQLERALEQFPGDPALLINLGIARAQNGEDVQAKALFRAALTSDTIVELEIAEGGETNSRRLARRALSMLDRGEFQLATSREGQ